MKFNRMVLFLLLLLSQYGGKSQEVVEQFQATVKTWHNLNMALQVTNALRKNTYPVTAEFSDPSLLYDSIFDILSAKYRSVYDHINSPNSSLPIDNLLPNTSEGLYIQETFLTLKNDVPTYLLQVKVTFEGIEEIPSPKGNRISRVEVLTGNEIKPLEKERLEKMLYEYHHPDPNAPTVPPPAPPPPTPRHKD